MKKLLLIIAATVFSMTVFGQTVWNVGNDAVNFPVNAGVASGNQVTKNGLTIVAGGTTITNMGQVEANPKTFTSPTTSTDYTFINRFKFNGAGYSGAANTDAVPTVMIPTQRYLTIQVSGNSILYFIGASGSGGSSRNLFVTDGTALVGKVNFPDTPLSEGTINYTGGATTLYVFCNAAINLYYITATNAVVTSTTSVNADKTIVSEKFYDVLGREIKSDSKGLVIKKLTYRDGTTESIKSYTRREK